MSWPRARTKNLRTHMNRSRARVKRSRARRNSFPSWSTMPSGATDRCLTGPAVRGFTGLLLAACIGAAAIAWQSPYGDAAIIATWAPQRVATSSPPLENPGLAQTAPEDVAPTAAALSPELTQLLQSMARDIATLGQGIELLKASQEQMARDNANAAEQLKASQEQMARVIAKASEQSLRPKISAPPPRPI